MEKLIYFYFVSYYYIGPVEVGINFAKQMTGYGCIEIKINVKIRTWDEITQVIDVIKTKLNISDVNISILNYKLMRIEKE